MFKTFKACNYRCLRDLKFAFQPFTVLIGKNDSGKSTILDAILSLSEMCNNVLFPWEESVFSGERSLSNIAWQTDLSLKITLGLEALDDGKEYYHEISMKASPEGSQQVVDETLSIDKQMRLCMKSDEREKKYLASLPDGDNIGSFDQSRSFLSLNLNESIQQANKIYSSVGFYRFDPKKLANDSSIAASGSQLLQHDGTGLPTLIDNIFTHDDSSRRLHLEGDMKKFIPSFNSMSLQPSKKGKEGYKSLVFSFRKEGGGNYKIPAKLTAEGVLLATAYIALLYGDTPDVLLIEEPENGLHPSRLFFIVDILQKISSGEVGGKPRQVILTTHSPLLLNHVAAESVFVVTGNKTAGTRIKPIKDIPDFEESFEDYDLGELWYNRKLEDLIEEES